MKGTGECDADYFAALRLGSRFWGGSLDRWPRLLHYAPLALL